MITQEISTISTLADAPNPLTDIDEDVFDSKGYTYTVSQATVNSDLQTTISQLNTFSSQANALEENVNAKEASTVAASETALQTANASLWVSGRAYTAGQNAISPINFQTYRATTNTSGTTDPSLSTSWTFVGLPKQSGNSGKFLTTDGNNPSWQTIQNTILTSERTSNTIISISDNSKLIKITSGTFTQTFDSCATLGNGWFCYIQNSGSGDITLDPNGSELIDGLSSYIMYPNEVRLLTCDGTKLTSFVLNPFYKIFTTSTNFIKPPCYQAFEGLLWGGGSSGRSAGQNAQGGGGGSCSKFNLLSSSLSSSTPITIGSGGAATSGSTINSGGQSSFNGILSNGGSTFTGGNAYNISISGVTSAGTSLFGGQTSSASAQPTTAIYGGGGGAGITSTPTALLGGLSIFGGNGGNSSLGSTAGGDGVVPAGGGGNSQSGISGAGARGEMRIWGIL